MWDDCRLVSSHRFSKQVLREHIFNSSVVSGLCNKKHTHKRFPIPLISDEHELLSSDLLFLNSLQCRCWNHKSCFQGLLWLKDCFYRCNFILFKSLAIAILSQIMTPFMIAISSTTAKHLIYNAFTYLLTNINKNS